MKRQTCLIFREAVESKNRKYAPKFQANTSWLDLQRNFVYTRAFINCN